MSDSYTELTGLPQVKEILRWEYRPGDRLIARTGHDRITREQALEITDRIRTALRLPEDAPIVIAGEGWTFEVLSSTD